MRLHALLLPALLLSSMLPGFAATSPAGVVIANIGGGYQTSFADLNGIAVFMSGGQLWRSDGTAAGTTNVSNGTGFSFNPESGTSTFTANGLAYFMSGGAGLWVSNGTAAGTISLVSNLNYNLTAGVAWNGVFLFGQKGGLWRSNGTVAGTSIVSAAPTVPSGFAISLDGRAFFTSPTASAPSVPSLWLSDGTSAGTIALTPAAASAGQPMAGWSNGANVVYFIASSASGSQIWKSDGTVAGTAPIAQPTWPAGGLTRLLYVDPVRNSLYFSADDGGHGNQLWSTDGTSCIKIIALNPGVAGQNIGPMQAINGEIVFLAAAANGATGLWSTNGTAAGTVPVSAFPVSAYGNPSFLQAVGRLYWIDVNVSPEVLMSTDGTAAGTGMVSNSNLMLSYGGVPVTVANTLFWPGQNAGQPAPFTLANQPPTVAVAASIAPSPIGGIAASLHVLGADDGGEPSLTYAWSLVNNALTAPIITPNASNAAKNAQVTFKQAGTYTFLVTIKDLQGAQVTSQVIATVTATPTAIAISPGMMAVNAGSSQQFTAVVSDQFGAHLAVQPAITWGATGGGTISSAGKFTAGAAAVPFAFVNASAQGLYGAVQIQVLAANYLAEKINFQPDSAATVIGYAIDDGSLVGLRANGLTYGWTVDQTDAVRKRGVNANELLDTLNQFHAGSKWEISLPNGTYNVLVELGDPSFASSYTLNVNGVAYCANLPLAVNAFTQITKAITVTNNLLTLDQGTAADKSTRIDYLEITTANPANGYVATVSGNLALATGQSSIVTVTLAGAAGSHSITLSNGATFGNGSTSMTQVGPGSANYTIIAGGTPGPFAVAVDAQPVVSGSGMTVTISDVPSRTTDAAHPCKPGIPVGVAKTVTVTITGGSGQMVFLTLNAIDGAASGTGRLGPPVLGKSAAIAVYGDTPGMAPGPARNLIVAKDINGGSLGMSPNYFCICNHPLTVTDSVDGDQYGDLFPIAYGINCKVTVIGDGKPNTGLLDQVTFIERVPPSTPTGGDPFAVAAIQPFAQKNALPLTAANLASLSDDKEIPISSVIYNSPHVQKTLAVPQCHSFTCMICQSKDVSVPNGGYQNTYIITPPVTNISNPTNQTVQFKIIPAMTTVTTAAGTWTCNPAGGSEIDSAVWIAEP